MSRRIIELDDEFAGPDEPIERLVREPNPRAVRGGRDRRGDRPPAARHERH
jgi:hypothetical protein